MADLILIPFPRLLGDGHRYRPDFVADVIHYIAEHREPCRATSEYLNRPCRSVAELEAMLRARADTTAAREGV